MEPEVDVGGAQASPGCVGFREGEAVVRVVDIDIVFGVGGGHSGVDGGENMVDM